MAEAKVPVTITYKAPGTQPPLYVAGSFSDPEWLPQQMDYTTDEDGEHTFKKELKLRPGSKFQYKFRVGEGDWWLVNNDAPIVTDESGNQNNLLEAPQKPDNLKLDLEVETEPDVKVEPQIDEGGIKQEYTSEEQPEIKKQSSTDLLDPKIKIESDTDDGSTLKTEPESQVQPTEATRGFSQANLKTPVTMLQESISRSGASTPGFVRTAAEVADSAALLDQEPPEPEIPDEEAGRLGVRRLSLTPIPQVAMTAAEVADTAETLDRDELKFDLVATPVTYHSLADARGDMRDDSLDLPGETQDRVPLFAHECIGLYEDDEIPGVSEQEDPEELLGDPVYEVDDVDMNDPTLEQFPSNRDQIMDTVRKMETGLNEDQTHFEGVPPSPIVAARSNSVTDLPGDFSMSPASSPTMSRTNHYRLDHRLDVPKRGSRGSLSSDRSSSVLSLGSIAESAEEKEMEHTTAQEIAPLVEQAASAEEAISAAKDVEGEVSLEAATSDESPTPVVLMPSPALKAVQAPPPLDSDEDEAVVLKGNGSKDRSDAQAEHSGYLTPERAASPRPPEPGSPTEPAPNTAGPMSGIETQDFHAAEQRGTEGPTTVVPENPESHSPKVMIYAAEPIKSGGASEDSRLHTEITNSLADGDETHSATDGPGTKSTGTDATNSTQLKKRNVPSPVDRAPTPASLAETRRTAAKNGNWFVSFCRLIFVDWIGGFIGRLLASRRKTLLTAGIAVVILGVAWWKARSQKA